LILSQGMTPQNGMLLTKRIDALVQSGLISRAMRDRLCGHNQANDDNRAGKIWFCFYAPRIAGRSGIERFFRSWGGEALYNWHERDVETGPVLTSIGEPVLVEAEVPIASFGHILGFAMKIARRYIVSRGYRSREPVDHEDYAKTPLPNGCIRRIVRLTDSDFAALTGSDRWV
jgi:hypothetical protein